MKIYLKIKPLLDFIFSLLLIILLSPFFCVIAILIKLDSKGPILFRQTRIGQYNKAFMMYKFRTMRIDTPKDQPTHLFQNPEMFITKIGKFLRKSSLDELPQFFNVLKGDMSFIGPRPALWNQSDLIELRTELGADKVKPGISGLAQVNGRDELPIEVKAKYDGHYANHVSFLFDFKIILKTFTSIFSAKGIREGGSDQEKKD